MGYRPKSRFLTQGPAVTMEHRTMASVHTAHTLGPTGTHSCEGGSSIADSAPVSGNTSNSQFDFSHLGWTDNGQPVIPRDSGDLTYTAHASGTQQCGWKRVIVLRSVFDPPR